MSSKSAEIIERFDHDIVYMAEHIEELEAQVKEVDEENFRMLDECVQRDKKIEELEAINKAEIDSIHQLVVRILELESQQQSKERVMGDFYVMRYVPETDQIEQLSIPLDDQATAERSMHSWKSGVDGALYVMEVKATTNEALKGESDA